MDPFALVSLALSVVLAVFKLQEYLATRREHQKRELFDEVQAGPRRDSIIADGAEQAVLALTHSLSDARSEINALKEANAQLEAENRAFRDREGMT
jgi:hypothetical protein